MKLFYCGLPGSGKTSKLIEHYLTLRTDPLKNNGYFIVPTSEHAERITNLVLVKKNPLFNKKIVTINQLLDLLISQKEISVIHQQYILKEIVRTLTLKYFKKVLQHNPFYQQLAGLINEAKEYSALPLQQDSPKKKELNLILETYNNYLKKNNLIDTVDKYQLAGQALQKIKLEYVLLDGFTSFNGRQKEFISALCSGSRVFIASLLDLPHYLEQKEFFLSLGLTAQPLSEIKRTAQKDLQHLALNFFNTTKTLTPIKAENLQELIAVNRLAEIEQIAREILLLKNNRQLNWSDFALIFRQIGDYKTLIYDIFENYNIPVTIHEGIYTQKNSFITWLLQLLKLAVNNYPKEDLLTVLKAGFYSIDRQAVDQLEIAALKKAVFNGAENWLTLSQSVSAELYKNLSRFFEVTQILAEQTGYQDLQEQLKKLVKELPLINKLQDLIKVKELLVTIKDISKSYNAFLELLTELAGIQKNFTAKEYPELIGDLEHYLTQNIISVKERQGNQVQVYDIPVARQKEYAVVFMPNLTTRAIPLHHREDLFLKDRERGEELKKSYEKQQEELLLFYQALCRPTEKLYFCYPQNELSGTKLEASHFLKQVRRLFVDTTIPRKTVTQTAAIPDIQHCFTEKELRTSLIFNLYKNFSETEIPDLLTKYPDLKIISDIIDRKKELNDFDQYSTATQNLLKNITRLKVKDLEVFSRCRFEFFCKTILKIFDPTEPVLSVPLGEIIHDTVEMYFKNNQATDILTVLSDLFPPIQLKTKLGFLQEKQLAIELAQLREKLKIFIDLDRAVQEKRKQYQPLFFELTVEEQYAGTTVSGIIDRLDLNDRQALIIDYKTGQLPEIAVETIKNGILPQIWLYAMILEKNKELTTAGCEYLHVPKYQRKGIYLETEKETLQTGQKKNIISREEMTELFKLSKKYLITYINEIQAGKFYQQNDKCQDYCQYKNICRMKKT